jgi:signal transduction histidine kinase/DNA-binding response OmpR family regulator
MAKEMGLRAYDIINNSNNLKARSDGYDIRGNIYETEKKYDSAYIFYTKALNLSKIADHHFRTSWSLYKLGKLEILMGHPDSAIYYLKTFINFSIDKSINSALVTRAYYEIAYVFDHMQQPDSVQKYKLKYDSLYLNENDKERINFAMKLAESNADLGALSISYYQIGEVFYGQKKYRLALTYFTKALEIKDSKDLEFESCLNNFIGSIYLELGNDNLALAYTLKGFKDAWDIGYEQQIATSFRLLGGIYKLQGKYEKAIAHYRMSYKVNCYNCLKIESHGSFIGIADSYMKLNQQEKALDYYKQSLSLAESSKSYPEQIVSNLKIGNFFKSINKSTSESYYLKAFQLSRKINDYSLIKAVADTLTSIARNKKNYAAAFNYLNISKEMNDSMQMNEQMSITEEWKTRFEFEKLDNENRAKITELAKERSLRKASITISVLMVFVVIIIFISYRRKRNDNKLLVSQKAEIEKISQQLHESDQAKLRFFTNISHELRTPLSLTIAPLSKLWKKEENEENKNEMAVILRNSRKLQDQISQLLDIAKIDKASLVLDLKMHDFNQQLIFVASMFNSLAEEKKIEYSINTFPGEIKFLYDSKYMEQIINNLLSNALKFTSQNGIVRISSEIENEKVILKIFDTGIGIPADSLEKVFDRFYQTDASLTRRFDGSGIGLALVKELVKLHNGTISVKSEFEKWTEFTVTFPMVKGPDHNETEVYQPLTNTDIIVSNEISRKIDGSKKLREKILLVEDNTDLRNYLNKSLSSDYIIIEAINGTEGIKTAKREIPDIIISDVMMPETDGYQLTSAIRAQIETCHIPIILLTAKAERESKIEGLERGADDYINKPFDEEEIHLKVKNILNGRQKLHEKFKIQNLASPSEISIHSMDDQFILKLVGIIEKEISNALLDVEYLSKNIGLSRQQLYRKLKAITGLTPVEFMRSIRIKRAAQLIQQKAATISEIAFMTGFENLSHFAKRFKEEYGQLPSEYGKSSP